MSQDSELPNGSGGSPASSTSDDGWTNHRVRKGFDVDGADSRTSWLDMDTRVAINQFLYEGTGIVYYTVGSISERALYPIFRAWYRLRDREAMAEQRIAEQEYIMHRLQDHERKGLTSIRGVLSLLLQIGWLLLAISTGYVAFHWMP